MNKTYKYISMVMLTALIYSCDTENNVILPESFNYISFESSVKSVNEPDGEVKVKFQYSTQTISKKDLTFNYTVSFPDGKTAAVENVDYTLPANSGTITLPAGETEIEVAILTLINNNVPKGLRHIKFDLVAVEGTGLGNPSDFEAGSVTLLIQEDDLFTFGYSSFEEVPTFVGDIYYSKKGVQDLVNSQVSSPSSTDPYVDFTATGQELGFDASFLSSSIGDSGSERIGVFSNANMDTAAGDFDARFTEGTQGYVTSDSDGTIQVVFDEVKGLSSAVTEPVLQAKIFIASTSYETGEGIEIFYRVNGVLGDPLISYKESAAEAVSGNWLDLSIPLPSNKLQNGNIVIITKNSSNSEMIFVDYVAIKGIP